MDRKILLSFIVIYCFAAGLGFFVSGKSEKSDDGPVSYILQGRSTAAVVEAVESVNGQITHEFRIINAVAATLTTQQLDALQLNPAVIAINEDVPVTAGSGTAPPLVSFADAGDVGPVLANL